MNPSPLRPFLLPALAAVGLTMLFWWPLWNGGGLIGGDLYSYFLPQKSFYADRLDAGELPLWNSLTGHGYPILGESQTGALYPVHLVLYAALSVNTAYHVNQLLHYVLAFLFCWMYARRLDLSHAGSLLAAVVYTYGWFPSRIALEWAIIGGAWFALALWCAESFLQQPRRRYLVVLALALGLQLLAGHYNLAFITHLTLAAYVPLRLGLSRLRLSFSPSFRLSLPLSLCLSVAVAGLLGYGLAAVQLLPSRELKRQSQRQLVDEHFDPGKGHIPPLYWSQIIAPWFWYHPEIDTDLAVKGLRLLAIPSDTNKVEAHLYFGMVPAVLVLWGLLSGGFGAGREFGAGLATPPKSRPQVSPPRADLRSEQWPGRETGPQQSPDRVWMILGAAALVYTSGWLVPLTKHLPGFGFFMGPGRYGIVTTMAVALLAGSSFGALMTAATRRPTRAALIVGVLGLTVADLWIVSRLVTYSIMLDRPLIKARGESIVGRLLHDYESRNVTKARLHAPGPNLPNLIGIASTPTYLGLSPVAYYDPDLRMPAVLTDDQADEQLGRLRRGGVTHLLTFEPLDRDRWPVTPLWEGFDPLLNPAWARFREPLFLYELRDSRGRSRLEPPRPGDDVRIIEHRANRVVIEAESAAGGRLVLTDLWYPGWSVAIDGRPAEAVAVEGLYRGVDLPAGKHTVVWTYRPGGVLAGVALGLAALLLLAVVGRGNMT